MLKSISSFLTGKSEEAAAAPAAAPAAEPSAASSSEAAAQPVEAGAAGSSVEEPAPGRRASTGQSFQTPRSVARSDADSLVSDLQKTAADAGVCTNIAQEAINPTDTSIAEVIPWQISNARTSTVRTQEVSRANLKEVSAVIKMQAVIRKHMARREFAYLVRRERLILVMMAIEDEKAALVQNLWRSRQDRRNNALEIRSAIRMQAAVRGRQTRQLYMPEKKVQVLVMRRAARRIQRYTRVSLARRQMKAQCRGILEKQGQIAIPVFGRMELVVWQERFVYATDRELCYQRLTKDRKANTSTTKVISYRTVREVKALLEEHLLVLVCETRNYKFAFSSPALCELWATNLLQLINIAGFEIEGFIEMPADEGGQSTVPLARGELAREHTHSTAISSAVSFLQ